MDCNTARMLLAFARPAEGTLDPADSAELEHHLAGCPDCEEHCRTERQLDQHLGEAMRRVEVPDRMQRVLLTRLAGQRQGGYRHRLRQGLAVAAGIAAVVLLGWGWVLWRNSQMPSVDIQRELAEVNLLGTPGPEEVEAYFARLGYRVKVPENLDFQYLAIYRLSEFKGQLVPQLIFRREDRHQEGATAEARVYLLSSKQFNLTRVIRPENDDGYSFRFEEFPLGDHQLCVVFYTGKDLKWLFRPVTV